MDAEEIMKKTAFATIVVALLLCTLCGCGNETPLPTTDRELLAYKSDGEYLIYSFNIRLRTDFELGTPWDERKDAVAEYIDSSGADVLCLQEVTRPQYEYLRDSLTNYQLIWYPRDDSADPEGLAIAYDDAFEAIEQQRFWLSETPDKLSVGWNAAYPRICVRALLRHESGDVIDVYNVHLDHISSAARTNGIKLVAERAIAAGNLAVIAGDFNADRESDCYAAISQLFDDAKLVARDSFGEYTFNDWGLFDHKNDNAIDHVFLSQGTDVKVYRVLYDYIDGKEGNYLSDHFAVGARFAAR